MNETDFIRLVASYGQFSLADTRLFFERWIRLFLHRLKVETDLLFKTLVRLNLENLKQEKLRGILIFWTVKTRIS